MPHDILLIEPCATPKQKPTAALPTAKPDSAVDACRPPTIRPIQLGLGMAIIALIGALVGGTWVAQYLPFTSSVEADSLNRDLARQSNQLGRMQVRLEERATIIRTYQQVRSAEAESGSGSGAFHRESANLRAQLRSESSRMQNDWLALKTQLKAGQKARDHKLAWMHHQLAVGYMGQERTQEAIAEMQKALNQAPEHPLMWNQLAYCYLAAEDASRAIQAFQRYAELSPEDPASHDGLAKGYQLAGNLNMAELEYRKALQLSPALGSAHYGLGLIYEQMGHIRLATRQYERYIGLGQSTPNEWVNRSRERLALLRLGSR